MIMGFFSKLRKGLEKTKHSLIQNIETVVRGYAKIDDDMYDDLEAVMLTGDMGVETTEYLLNQIRTGVKNRDIKDGNDVVPYLEGCIFKLLNENDEPLPETEGTRVIFVVGVNGVGKTTTIAKLAGLYKKQGRRVMLAAGDTFRAAAIEQLDVWGQRAGVPVIKRDRGSDPASVCYDVLDEADKRGSDLVLIDTAGRLHTSPELMRELAKVVNVTRKRAANMAAGPMPVSVVLVIDAATGQNGLNQALEFNEALGLDGIIMTKLDGTAKGGIAMAVAEKLKLPILRVGVGEQVDDLQEFNAKDFCRALVGESN